MHPGDPSAHPDDGRAEGSRRLRLDEERETLRERIAGMRADMSGFFEASRDSNADDEHDPEGQTIAFERSQLAAVTEQALGHLAEVEAALGRLHDGSYGICEGCCQPIDPARLDARPTARTCVNHSPVRPR